MPLYIRDDEAHQLAARLAKQRSCTVTDAVKGALTEALEREAAAREAKLKRIREILARVDALPRLRTNFTDKDLYDKNGLPIL